MLKSLCKSSDPTLYSCRHSKASTCAVGGRLTNGRMVPNVT